MSARVKLVDTTMRDGSHSVAHQYTPDQVRTATKLLDDAGVWAIAVGHGDGLGAGSRQYGYAAYPDHELLAAAAEVVERAELAVALLPGIGTKDDLRAAQDAGATVVRVSTVITEADIGIQHLKLARELGMTAHSHLNMASIGSVEQTVEAAKIVREAGSQAAYLVDSCGAYMQDDVRARVSALHEEFGDELEIGIHEHNNLSLAVSNSVAAIQEGATIADVTLAGMGAGAGNCQGEALVAVLERLGIDTGADLLKLQDAADGYVRKELMPGPIVVDRLTASMGFANVPASFLLHAIRAGDRYDVDPRDIILALGKRGAVTGQEDLILEVAAGLAAGPCMTQGSAPLFVIDDDPTGAQSQAEVPLLLAWNDDLIDQALEDSPRALHLLTNSRAMSEEDAYKIVRGAAEAVVAAVPDPDLVLRGDSTLRAHLLPEYNAVRDVLWPGSTPTLLLVPALPAAGRITRDGTHFLVRGGETIPLDKTEFATDGDFSYTTSRLIDWAEERSGGYFSPRDGVEIGLDQIRSPKGAELVCEALRATAAGPGPAVVVPDAESIDDLAVIAAGLRMARAETPGIIVRCAPTFASVMSGAAAEGFSPLPLVERGLLVVVGSHVPMTTAQLATLKFRIPDVLVELDAGVLAGVGAGDAGAAGAGAGAAAGDEAAAAVDAAVKRAKNLLDEKRIAIVATSRLVDEETVGPDSGLRIARALASVVDQLRGDHDVLLSKGGITSAVNVRDGLGADRAQIIGPVAAGIALWLVFPDAGEPRPVIVFPGNVGDTNSLAELVQRLMEQ